MQNYLEDIKKWQKVCKESFHVYWHGIWVIARKYLKNETLTHYYAKRLKEDGKRVRSVNFYAGNDISFFPLHHQPPSSLNYNILWIKHIIKALEAEW